MLFLSSAIKTKLLREVEGVDLDDWPRTYWETEEEVKMADVREGIQEIALRLKLLAGTDGKYINHVAKLLLTHKDNFCQYVKEVNCRPQIAGYFKLKLPLELNAALHYALEIGKAAHDQAVISSVRLIIDLFSIKKPSVDEWKSFVPKNYSISLYPHEGSLRSNRVTMFKDISPIKQIEFAEDLEKELKNLFPSNLKHEVTL